MYFLDFISKHLICVLIFIILYIRSPVKISVRKKGDLVEAFMESLSWNSHFKTNTTLFLLLYKVIGPIQLPILRVSKSTFTTQKVPSPKRFLLKYVARIELKV